MSSTSSLSSTVTTDLPVIDLVHPLPGFPDARRFALVQLDDEGHLCDLRSLDQDDLSFLVVPPAYFFADYSPVLDDATVADLAIESADEVLVLVILTAGASLAATTANLLAPVVVNTRTRQAVQVVLDDTTLSTATPVLS
ncbi:flagellar assembly protein FliW [Nocardioides rubriscoriae]|uniref:flagellar assembly protein FliW n=1 Tax=Nocardioides rubriscoriae TaxID=642762 RepID=UPI0011DFE3BC|nr:flagellar assembly protein FliW [Nocardioides rubriscoriae]